MNSVIRNLSVSKYEVFFSMVVANEVTLTLNKPAEEGETTVELEVIYFVQVQNP